MSKFEEISKEKHTNSHSPTLNSCPIDREMGKTFLVYKTHLNGFLINFNQSKPLSINRDYQNHQVWTLLEIDL